MTYKTGTFEQKTREVFSAREGLLSDKINCIAFDGQNRLFVGTDKGLQIVADGKVLSSGIKLPKGSVDVLYFSEGGELFVGTDKKLLGFTNGKKTYAADFPSVIVDVKRGENGALWVLTSDSVYKFAGKSTEPELRLGVPGTPSCLVAYKDDRVFVGTKDNGMHTLAGKRRHWAELKSDDTGMLSNTVNALFIDEADNIWAATDKGVCVYDDKSLWLTPSVIPALPSAFVTDIASDEKGDKYFTTTTGLIHQHGGMLSYYGYKRWLPSPKAKKVTVAPNGTVAVLTDKGISVIKTEPLTLEKKAALLKADTEQFNVRKDGWVLDRTLDHEGVVSADEGYIPNTDNDGLRTGLYVAALCFEYACTHDKETKKQARRSLDAMLKLLEVTGIEGFAARAVRYPDEREYGTGNRKEWHITKDKNGNELEWLGETSSDEMVGHFFCYAHYYDLAADEEEKKLLRAVVSSILDHILSHGYHLCDTDGKPTTWANWNPELLNNDHKWINEKGTNSLQLLTFLAAGYHMTGNEKYKEEFDRLAKDKHYVLNLMQYAIPNGHILHIDDSHDFIMISLLLEYVKEPTLRSVFMMGLRHHWEDERIERNAFYNFVYGALTGENCDIENAVEELTDYPMDPVAWPLYNSYRKDIEWDFSPVKMGMIPQLCSPLSPHERRVVTNDINRFIADSGAEDVAQTVIKADGDMSAYNVFPPTGNDKGLESRSCTMFTLPYWYARYKGLIE